MAHALVIKFSEIRIVLSQHTHQYGPNKKDIQFFLYLGLIILSNEFFSYLILTRFIYRALAVQGKGNVVSGWMALERCTMSWGRGLKGRQNPNLKITSFLL